MNDNIRDWRHLAPPLVLGVLLLGGLFRHEVAAAVQTWSTSTAYNHCFLIIPIVAYLLWDRRLDVAGVRPDPWPAALLLSLPLIPAWLLAERLGIMEGRQLIAVSFLELLLLAVFGRRLWWAMAGPLLYLYFLVPFGEFLTPWLQDITTWFIRRGLEILGIPAFIDGYIIDIPQGSFFVAEACAGLRFLIASTAFGCLYALLMLRSPMRRALFILAAVIVPIAANGLRALGIVSLGYLLGSAQAAVADHIVYGWLFFSLVILLLIAAGLPFRQDDRPTTVTIQPDTAKFSMRAVLRAELALLLSAAASPALAAALSVSTPLPPGGPALIKLGDGCAVQASKATAGRTQTQRIVCRGVAMDVTWERFSPRITAAPLLAARRRLTTQAANEDTQEDWLADEHGPPSPWRIMFVREPAFVLAVSLWVDGQPVRPGLHMRARMAVDSLLGATSAPMVVTVTPVNAERPEARANLTDFLLGHTGLDDEIAALSAR